MKGKKGGLGAFCYLAVFAMALLSLPALLWFCRRGAGEEVTLPVVMYHRVCEQEEDTDRYTVSAADYPEAVILDAGDQVELSYRETEGLLIGAEDFKLVSRKAEEPEREETQ